MEDKERFMSVYDKVPEAERNFTIIIIDDKEITWEMAKKEIESGTELGRRIKQKLIDLEII